MFEGGGLFTYEKTVVRFSMLPTGFGEAESNPLLNRAISATFNVLSIATELGRDPDTRCIVPTSLLLAPQAKARERTLGRRRVAGKTQTNVFYVYIYSLPGVLSPNGDCIVGQSGIGLGYVPVYSRVDCTKKISPNTWK